MFQLKVQWTPLRQQELLGNGKVGQVAWSGAVLSPQNKVTVGCCRRASAPARGIALEPSEVLQIPW